MRVIATTGAMRPTAAQPASERPRNAVPWFRIWWRPLLLYIHSKFPVSFARIEFLDFCDFIPDSSNDPNLMSSSAPVMNEPSEHAATALVTQVENFKLEDADDKRKPQRTENDGSVLATSTTPHVTGSDVAQALASSTLYALKI